MGIRHVVLSTLSAITVPYVAGYPRNLMSEIFGGTEITTDLSAFESQAMLIGHRHDGKIESYCLGVLIGPQSILTTATCAPFEAEFEKVEAQFGAQFDPKQKSYTVQGFATDNVDENSGKNDIAVFTLSESVKNVKPASILRVAESELGQWTYKVAGFGVSKLDYKMSPTLLTTDVSYVSSSDCKSKFDGYGWSYGFVLDLSTSFCGNNKANQKPCNGDTGAALYVDQASSKDPVIAGIYSNGAYGCQEHYPAIYTSPYLKYDFIHNNAGGVTWVTTV